MRKHIVTGAFTAALQMTLIAIQPEWFRAHWPYVLGFLGRSSIPMVMVARHSETGVACFID
jgi:hypothetical protein